MKPFDGTGRNPMETHLVGTQHNDEGTGFGLDWYDRTYGLGAVKVTWRAETGIESIEVLATPLVGHPSFFAQYTASTTSRWFKLLRDESLVRVNARVATSCARICSVCFETNLRRSQWFGSHEQTSDIATLEAPPGNYLHMLHGANAHGMCVSLGALVMPLALRACASSGCVSITESSAIGATAIDATSPAFFKFQVGAVRAIVVTVDDWVVKRIRPLGEVAFRRHLAERDAPLADGVCLFVLVDDEGITGLRAAVADDGAVVSIQLITTHQTTEWFGAVPRPDTQIQMRTISDVTSATHCWGCRPTRALCDRRAVLPVSGYWTVLGRWIIQ